LPRCQSTARGQYEIGARLRSGEVIRDCRVGYRIYGKLNTDRLNALLFPTWASGQPSKGERRLS
jgi:homoserine acetyltransferase